MSKQGRSIRLAFGTVIMLFLGLIYAWSVFVAPLEAEFGWKRAQTSLTFTVSIIFFVVGLILCGALVKRIPRRAIMVLAGACMLAGFFFCTRITQPSQLVGLYLSYGVLVGFGVGLANNALVSSIIPWFPERAGAASGVLMMGFGFGGLVLSPLANQLISDIGWRETFLGFGLVFSIIVALGWFIAVPPKVEPGAQTKAADEGDQIPTLQVIRRRSYWVYILWFALTMAGGLMIIGHAKPFAEDLGAGAALAATFAGLLSFSNGIGRVVTGLTCDKLGLRVSMHLTTLYLLLAAAMLTLAAATQSIVLLSLGYIFAGLSYGGGPTTSSMFARTFYGPKYFSGNYACVSSGMIPGAIIGPYLAGILHDSSGGYFSSFAVLIVFGLLGFLALRFLKKA